MKKQFNCPGCGKPYWAGVVKYYVLNYRYCPKCDGIMLIKGDTLVCSKCGETVERKIKIVTKLKTKIAAEVFKDQAKAEKLSEQGYEVAAHLIPDKEACQRCRTLKEILQQQIHNKKQKGPFNRRQRRGFERLMKREQKKKRQKEPETKVNVERLIMRQQQQKRMEEKQKLAKEKEEVKK